MVTLVDLLFCSVTDTNIKHNHKPNNLAAPEAKVLRRANQRDLEDFQNDPKGVN